MARIAENSVILDGQLYQAGTGNPGFRKLDVRKTDSGRRFYEGISRDLEKLPHYVEHGSRAQCLDTGDIFTFHKKLDTWFKL